MIVNIWVFKVDTVIDLYDLISATIKDLRERGLLQKDVELLRVLYKYGGKLLDCS